MKRMSRQGYSVEMICAYIGITRQAYYKRLKKQEERERKYALAEELVIKNRIKRSRCGLRVIYHKENITSFLGINQFERQMSKRGFALKPYRSYKKTTDSRGHHYKFDNLISGLKIQRSNQVIVGDITYYENGSNLYYIFHFIDCYTTEVKGLIGSITMEGKYAEMCLQQVFAYNKQRKYNNMLILHTDGGSQYRSHKFQKMLRNAQIRPSQAKSCYENGLSERENGIIKNEYLIDYKIRNVKELNQVLRRIKYQINEVWPSKSLGYVTPKKFSQWIQTIKPEERPVKTIKIV